MQMCNSLFMSKRRVFSVEYRFPERNPSGQYGLLTYLAIKRLQIDYYGVMLPEKALDVLTSFRSVA